MAKDFAFRSGESYDIWSGKRKVAARVHEDQLEDHPIAKKVGMDKNDVSASVESAGRADFEKHVVVPAGSRRPGKFRADRHGGGFGRTRLSQAEQQGVSEHIQELKKRGVYPEDD